jgi:hypothetical protein
VINTFQALPDDTSIEKAYQRLIETATTPLHDIQAHEKTQVLRAIFAVLCWTSATLTPLLDEEATTAKSGPADPAVVPNSSLVAENSSERYSSKDFRRPISKMFYSFRNQAEHPEGPEHHPTSGGTKMSVGSSDDVLYESSLSYASLFTMGRVRLEWVDRLTGHLAFDRSTRTLSVFRFPSFCVTQRAAQTRRQGTSKVCIVSSLPFSSPFFACISFPCSPPEAADILMADAILIPRLVSSSITAKLLPSHYYADSPREPSALHREVLLSYRLLFGQSSSPRKLLSQLLRRSSSSTAARGDGAHPTAHHRASPSSSDVIADHMDPFLTRICTSPLRSRWRRLGFIRREHPSPLLPSTIFPSSALDLDDQLQESETDSAHDDFAVFGPRLLILQRYNMRQQPSKVKDLWRDRRNPLQWYTFWAVLWIGGAGIVLAVLQVLVGIVQVYLTARPLGAGVR